MRSRIRKSADDRIFAPARSLSQLVTSFFGSWCQGIPLALFIAWPIESSLILSWIMQAILQDFWNCNRYPSIRCSTIKTFILPNASAWKTSLLPCLSLSSFFVQFSRYKALTWSQMEILDRSNTSIQFQIGGDSRDRTGDLLLARQALSQLSYIPVLSSWI